ncbi:TIGR03087 family PEP-CTERM/XrtA system glycosyltransferase [Magnetospira sp. QH-2]|uniref:TIGR03087 family PEP-CTERM/XrtA system glycosyltransferase n=1 Tax=Magnetospira sp. (strain QH-2) TaxID=1288970 RepID=UPI0003E81098|nr:TIGR03087 family PEP-CTERM/XrtA system glycosyltransferase [Magnetospira sp. QH-2]CCQ72963.1 putative GT4 [Magnetospira sp. QH-2]
MDKLLFLVHRLPYPPNKGDKIATHNMLKYFSTRCRIFLGTFIDAEEDWQYLPMVEEMCAETCIIGISPKTHKAKSVVKGLLSGEALSLPFYRNAQLQAWVDRVVAEEKPDAVLVYSGVMGLYLIDGKMPPNAGTLLNMEDVDSEKWRAYGEQKTWPLSWLYRREADKLLAFETKASLQFDTTVFISKAEADLFRSLAPECADRTTNRTQGVDSEYFDPSLSFEDPYPSDSRVLVFTGAMDYWPNIDAVTWFVNEVLPKVRKAVPDVLFCIVGMRPSPAVRKLGERPGVLVTGGVPDVRPFLSHAIAAVLPLRIARGIQNKVLEAMAMELPVLASSNAMTGIPDDEAYVVDTPEETATKAIALLREGRQQKPAARQIILDQFDWNANLRRLETILTESSQKAQENASS